MNPTQLLGTRTPTSASSLPRAVLLLALIFLSPLFCQVSPAAAPTDAEIRDAYHKSYRYEKAQNYTDAIKALAPVITAYPTAYTVNLRLGWLNYLTGSFATARTHYQTAIKTAPDSLEAKLGHTLPLMAQEKWEDVETLAKQILRVDPANYTANLRLAYASRLQKKFDAAEAILNGTLVLYPTDISLLTELALVVVTEYSYTIDASASPGSRTAVSRPIAS